MGSNGGLIGYYSLVNSHSELENHNLSWVNRPCLPCSIAMLNYQRVGLFCEIPLKDPA